MRLQPASAPPVLGDLLEAAGRVRDRLDHPQLRDVRRLLRATRPGGVDVLLLGESVLSFVGPQDGDRRNLPTMVADDLGGDISVLAVHGGGYHAGLLAAYLTLLAERPHVPKVVVLPLWVRGRLRPWIEHPRFGHVDAVERIERLSPGTPPWRVRGSLVRASAGDFERYYSLSYNTLLGDLTVGEYARPLKGHELSGAERVERLYAFHHGAALAAGSEALRAVTDLGAAAAALGSLFFAYETPISVATGERVLGPAFREVVTTNFVAMGGAFRKGAGSDAAVLPTGMAFGEEEFIDPADGTEHLAEAGRRRLATLLADEVRRRLP